VNAPRDLLPLSRAVADLRLGAVVDSLTLSFLIETLDGLLAPTVLPRDLPGLLDAWVDAHLFTERDEGVYDAAHLRYMARAITSIQNGFSEALAVLCERVWVWRKTAGMHCKRTLPPQWSGVL
jgi:hypothetical protein